MTHNGDAPPASRAWPRFICRVGSGTKAYTYDLKGIETGHGQFQLHVHRLGDDAAQGFSKFQVNGIQGRGRCRSWPRIRRELVSVPATERRSHPTTCPKFEATWDATESADIKGVIAAQKAVDAADYAAAMKARDETMKNAPPKQLASKDLVRKSRAYWDGYQTDMIREVFDGGFGAAIDENEQFQRLFCTYVEMYSAKYAALLPANHQTVTITQKTNRKFDQQWQPHQRGHPDVHGRNGFPIRAEISPVCRELR